MDNRWILREQLEIVICLRSIASSLFFSFPTPALLRLRNGAFWAVLIHFVKDDDDIGRVSGSNLSLQKSDIDKYISPSCIKLKSKLMVQNLIEEE